MRLLDRYLLRELLVPLGYCLGGFLLFWISFDLLSELNHFQKQRLQVLDVVEYYLVKTPELLLVVIPIALLLALLYALTNHARHQELTAMRAAGVGVWRITLPYLAVGFAFSFILFGLNEFCVPSGAEAAEEIANRRLSPQEGAARRQWQTNLFFNNTHDNRVWQIGAYNVKTHEMRDLQMDWRLPDGSRQQFNADRATWTNRTWLLWGSVQKLAFPPSGTDLPTRSQADLLLMPELSEKPARIKSEIKISKLDSIKDAKKAQLSIKEIRHYLQWHPRLEAKKYALLMTKLHNRFATPWTCVVVALIAIPFGAASGRLNVFVGVASSIFICFAYFILRELSLALGSGSYVDPWLAAWAPNMFFSVTGIILTFRIR
jgi:lipopolysaccharide export system permease protein